MISTTTRKEIIAAILVKDAEICLLRRSPRVRFDRGLWHCITGYMDDGRTPLEQALVEVNEEAGFDRSDVHVTYQGELAQAGWLIHVIVMRVSAGAHAIRLNWENDAYRWTPIKDAVTARSVPWLGAVLDSVPARTFGDAVTDGMRLT
jgi:8-oxo-dGTP pyrophosphatase MutT (NUDIX family)